MSRIHLLRRVSWNVVDQGLSTLSNVVLSVLVARSVDASTFGAFAIAFLVYGIAVSLTKALVGEPLQIRFSAAPEGTRRSAMADALGLALLLGVAIAVVAAVVALGLPGPLRGALLAVAVVMPGLLVQDSCRMAMFTLGRPAQAAAIDAVWAVVQVGLLAVLLGMGRTDIGELVLAWGVAALASVALGLVLLKVVPRPRNGLRWLRAEWPLIRYLLAEYLLGLGAAQVAIMLVGVVAAANAVGSLRAAQVLLGPLGVVGIGAFQFAVPEIARRTGLSASARTRFALALSSVLGAGVVAYLLVLLVLPQSAGEALFGDSWAGAAAVMVAMGISSLASSLAVGPSAVLYGMGQARATFRITAAKGPVLIAAVLLGSWQAGALGAAWALALVEAAMLPPFWWALRRTLQSQPSAAELLPVGVAR